MDGQVSAAGRAAGGSRASRARAEGVEDGVEIDVHRRRESLTVRATPESRSGKTSSRPNPRKSTTDGAPRPDAANRAQTLGGRRRRQAFESGSLERVAGKRARPSASARPYCARDRPRARSASPLSSQRSGVGKGDAANAPAFELGSPSRSTAAAHDRRRGVNRDLLKDDRVRARLPSDRVARRLEPVERDGAAGAATGSCALRSRQAVKFDGVPSIRATTGSQRSPFAPLARTSMESASWRANRGQRRARTVANAR